MEKLHSPEWAEWDMALEVCDDFSLHYTSTFGSLEKDGEAGA